MRRRTPAPEIAAAARRVAIDLRTLVAELGELRSENETLRAEHRALLEALTMIAGPLQGRPGARRVARPRRDRRAPGGLPVVPSPVEPGGEVAGLRLDAASHTVSWNGRALALTPREFALFSYLLDHRGRPLGRQELLGAVFPTSSDDPRTLRVHIQALRTKMELLDPLPVVITTLHGIGYRLDHVEDTGRPP